jgi:mannose-1-phosphate guanylyltransferase
MAVGSHVAPDAVVTRSVLGRDVHVASGAQVDGCVLLDGARVDEDAQLTNSIVGPGGHIERKAVLDDYTIVGANATVTAGTRLSRTKVGVGETS